MRGSQEDHWRRWGWCYIWKDEQTGARRKECEEMGSQYHEGKAMGHGGSQSLWVASMILWLESRRTADGPEAGKHRTRSALRQLTSTETEILSHPHSQARNKNTF